MSFNKLNSSILQFHFAKSKYGIELLMDIGTYKDIPNYYFESVLHYCDFYEIVIFKKGKGYLELDNKIVEIGCNIVVFLSPFQKRKWFVEKRSIECVFLFFQDTFLTKFFTDKLFAYKLQYFYNKFHPLTLILSSSEADRLLSVCDDLYKEIKNLHTESEHLIRALLYYILVWLNRAYANCYGLSSETNLLAVCFKSLLQQQVIKYRNVDYYSNKLKISRVTLNKCITKHYGITVSEMIDNFILYEIKERLLYSNLNMKEIAFQLNFSEANHMSRFFKAKTGYTLTNFRKAYQNGISVF